MSVSEDFYEAVFKRLEDNCYKCGLYRKDEYGCPWCIAGFDMSDGNCPKSEKLNEALDKVQKIYDDLMEELE